MRWINRILPIVALLIFAIAIYFIHHVLKQHSYREIAGYMKSIPMRQRALAMALTCISYVVLSSYDFMAFRYIGKRLSPLKIAFGSFTAFAFSNNIGLANLAGSSIRLRIYSTYGVEPKDTLKIIAFNTVTFWIGFFALAGVTLMFSPLRFPPQFGIAQDSVRAVGAVLFVVAFGYLLLSLLRRKPVQIRGWVFELPSFGLSFLQILVAAGDWALAGVVLYVLLPASSGVSFIPFLAIFISAQVVALLAHVPGGVGVLEALVIYFVNPDHQPSPEVLGALLAYRVIYYLIPLVTAATLLVAYEIYRKRHFVKEVGAGALNWTSLIIPHVASIMTFLAGATMLVSGVTPDVHARMRILVLWLPLTAIEASHFLSSCVGAALLIVAQALLNRSHAAWLVTIALLLLGAVLSLTRGIDYEVTLVLMFFMTLLYASRGQFHRKSLLTSERLTPTWLAAMTMVILGTIWIGLFVHRHFEYSNNLWWKFALDGGAPRFLRASFGGLVTCIGLSLFYLLRPHRPAVTLISASLKDVLPIALSAGDPMAARVFGLESKLLMNTERDAFLAYVMRGDLWVSIGGPFGNTENFEDLIIDFTEIAKSSRAQVAFHQVAAENLSLLIDLGLEFAVVGEDHLLALTESLEPRDAADPELKVSISTPDDQSGQYFPIAAVHRGAATLAAVILFPQRESKVLSVDQVIVSEVYDSPVADLLFAEVARWAQANGYQSLNIGGLQSDRHLPRGVQATRSVIRFLAFPSDLGSIQTLTLIGNLEPRQFQASVGAASPQSSANAVSSTVP